ncbi:hypothetical protein CWI39_1059p0010 [Hamiltosporidium magnivora]|uniref:Uncharacterized protein n=1 Tax=Hamiltosporidium magnivora TaxID=148818 RepID=A0A4Q9L5S1_9MICR|nr:hypothetical protein CWI39_1059p0010 [Hamiltosporidium magnivora]
MQPNFSLVPQSCRPAMLFLLYDFEESGIECNTITNFLIGIAGAFRFFLVSADLKAEESETGTLGMN